MPKNHNNTLEEISEPGPVEKDPKKEAARQKKIDKAIKNDLVGLDNTKMIYAILRDDSGKEI